MRASKSVYHPNGDPDNFQTVEEALDDILYGSTAKIGGTVGTTDNRLPRSDGTGGKTLQATGITVDDSDNVTVPGAITSGGLDVPVKATVAQYRNGTTGALAITPGVVWSATVVETLTDGATITADFSAGFNFSVSLGGNRTLGNPTNPKVGQAGCIAATASGATRTLDRGSQWKSTSAISWPISIPSGETYYIFYFVFSSTITLVTGVLANPA